MPNVRFHRNIVIGKQDCFAGEEKELSVIDATYAVEIYKAAEYVAEPAGEPGEVTDKDPASENGDPKGAKKGK